MVESIISLLNHHSEKYADKKAFVFIDENSNEIDQLSYRQLRDDSENIASFLQSKCEPRDRVLLLFQPGLDYVRALFACFIAGVIAVPLYPPRRNKKAERILRVAESCAYSLILCGEQDRATIVDSFDTDTDDTNVGGMASEESIRLHTVESIKKNNVPKDNLYLATSKDIAFLQYTSGSTGMPKGVVINHENILGNVEALTRRVKSGDQDIFVNWLPLFHDLGLITAVLWPVYLGATSILISPAHFVRSPMLWLKAITKYRGTICGAPNFAYQLCSQKISDHELPALDLSSWRVAYNAAEPIQADTIVNFNDKFSTAKLTSAAQLGSYGMAEATAFMSCGDIDKDIFTCRVDTEAFSNNQIVFCDKNDKKSQVLIGCGKAADTHDIRIVNPNTGQELPDEHIGEIWFSGPSVSQGYWELPEITKETFGQSLKGRNNQYMRTGDFGFMHKGEVFVTGRMKDIIILEGRNYYPQDIEWHVENNIEEVARFACASFSHQTEEGEKLVIVAEIARSSFRNSNFSQIIKDIRQKISSEFYIYPDLVALVKPLTMPKTSSGKIQRKLTQAKLSQGELTIVARSDDMADVEYIPPVSEYEKKLCLLLSQIIRKNNISVVDNFFEMGLESITAIEFIGAIKENFNHIELSFEQLFVTSSIKDLATYIEKRINLEALHRSVSQASTLTEEFEV